MSGFAAEVDMQLEHIILFDKIAKEKSISRVAAASNISQPALSQQMQRLEEEVGLKLLERSNRGIELTDAGRIMQKYAQQIIAARQQFLKEIENLQKHSDTLRIAATTVAGNYAIPFALPLLKSAYPQFSFSLASMPSYEVMRRVTEGRADIGFIVGAVEKPGLVCEKSFSDDIHLVAAWDYDVQGGMTLSDLRKYPLITLNERFSSYRLLLEQLKSLGYNIEDFNVLYHMDSTESVKALVAEKCGMAFLPYMAVKQELEHHRLRLVEVENLRLSYDVHMLRRFHDYPPKHPISTIAKDLVRILRQSVSR